MWEAIDNDSIFADRWVGGSITWLFHQNLIMWYLYIYVYVMKQLFIYRTYQILYKYNYNFGNNI